MPLPISFFAGLLLKMHAGESWTAEEVQALRMASAMLSVHEGKVDVPMLEMLAEKVEVPEVTEEPVVPVHEAPKKIKKVKKVEDTKNDVQPVQPPQPQPEPVQSQPVQPELQINAKHCLARKVEEKHLPGTDDNKVYEVKQCSRNRAKGELLCPKCEEFYTAYKEKSKNKKKWCGFINETPLEHLHVVGSKWFEEQYPAGLPNTAVVVPVVPSDPTKETVLADNVPMNEVKWEVVKINGIQYIYNLRDRRMYRADCTKTGEDQIVWSNYEGKYVNGVIDAYAEENEDVPEEC